MSHIPVLKFIVTKVPRKDKCLISAFFKNAEVFSNYVDICVTPQKQRYIANVLKHIPEQEVHNEGITFQSAYALLQEHITEFMQQEIEADNVNNVQVVTDEVHVDDDDGAKYSLEDHEAAKRLARNPNMLAEIAHDIKMMGVVGQTEIALAVYLVATSRLLNDPLHMIIQGPSGHGKSYIVERVTGLFPDEAKFQFGAMTPQALYYLEKPIKHKVLVGDERPRQTSYESIDLTNVQRQLISTKKVSKVVTTKTSSGSMVSKEFEVQGPAATIMTASHDDIPTEDKNRCIVMTVHLDDDECEYVVSGAKPNNWGRRLQREEQQAAIVRKHHLFQKSLEPTKVGLRTIIYDLLTLKIRKANRQDILRTVNLAANIIAVSALLHKEQRIVRDGYVLADLRDYNAVVPILNTWLGGIYGKETNSDTVSEFPNLSRNAARLLELMRNEMRKLNKQRLVFSEIYPLMNSFSKDSVYRFLRELTNQKLIVVERCWYEKARSYALSHKAQSLSKFRVQHLFTPATKNDLLEAIAWKRKLRGHFKHDSETGSNHKHQIRIKIRRS